MKACPDRNETLMLDLYGELEPEAALRWEGHLESCDDCRRERRRLQTLIGRIRDADAAAALTPQESSALRAELHRRTAPVQNRFLQPRSFLRGLPALAAAAMLVLAVWVFQERTPAPPAVPTVDIYRQLSEEDLEVIRNLDMLKQFQTIEKLSRVVHVSGDRSPVENREQGASRDDFHAVLV